MFFFSFFYVHQSSNSPRLFKQLLSETLVITDKRVCATAESRFKLSPEAFFFSLSLKVNRSPHSGSNECRRLHPRARSRLGGFKDEAGDGQDRRWKDSGGGWRDCGRFTDAVKEEVKLEPVPEERRPGRRDDWPRPPLVGNGRGGVCHGCCGPL